LHGILSSKIINGDNIITIMRDLTTKQSKVLGFICDQYEKYGVPPSRHEIQTHFRFSSINAVTKHVAALVAKGAVTVTPNQARGIMPVGKGGVPVVGRIAAGSPILGPQNIETHFRLDPVLFQPRADYLLRVKGPSMRDVGILDGDLVAIHRTPEARSGQIVAARIRDEVTLKRLKRSGNSVKLFAENPDYLPIQVDLQRDQFVIEGIYVGIVRIAR
jgi:repressor LexA